MRRSILVAITALSALTLAGIAVAKLSATGTEAVSATFDATNVVRASTHTCTGVDGTYEITRAVYSGNAHSTDAALDGPIRIRVVSVYNTTEQLGSLDAVYWTTVLGRRAQGHLTAVNSNGTLDGFLRGRVSRPYGRLYGGVSSSWSRTGGFTNGKLGGGGSSADVALVLEHRPCVPSPRPADRSVRLHVKGTIDALSSTSISVKPEDGSAVQSCAITTISPGTSRFAQGDKVAMNCATLAGTLTLTTLYKRR